MASKGILYIVISGPDDYQRASEGLRMAEYQAGDGTHGVAVICLLYTSDAADE